MKIILEILQDTNRKELMNMLEQVTNNFNRDKDAKTWASLVKVCKLIAESGELLNPKK